MKAKPMAPKHSTSENDGYSVDDAIEATIGHLDNASLESDSGRRFGYLVLAEISMLEALTLGKAAVQQDRGGGYSVLPLFGEMSARTSERDPNWSR